MTAAAVAALTVYDMVKGLERGVRIEAVELLSKSGGRSGDWVRDAPGRFDPRVVAVATAGDSTPSITVDGPRRGGRQRDDQAVGVQMGGRAPQRLQARILVGGVLDDHARRRRR